MPELPEVETVRTQIALLEGAEVVAAWAAGFGRFATAATAAGVITGVSRRGKYLLVHLGGDDLVVHLGMSGVLWVEPDHLELPPAQPHVHVRLHLRGPGSVLRTVSLRDPRRFGMAVLVPAGEPLPAGLRNLGPEPRHGALTPQHLQAACSRTHRSVKAVLLDQSVIAGVGNIYADEALYAARVHPATPASRLTRRQIEALCVEVIAAIDKGLRAGGTTFRDYRRPDGSAGSNQHQLLAYGREGMCCSRCGATMRADRVAGRTSVFCPRCQRVLPARRSC